jgi:hypothetical protein
MLSRCYNRGDSEVALRAIAAVALLALAAIAGLTLRPAGSAGPEFGFSIVEDYSTYATPVSPGLYFKVYTAASFPCVNYGIPPIVSLVDRHLSVDLGEIVKPDTCLTAIGPATGHAELNLPDGHYYLTISSRGRTDTYDLDVTSSKTSLNSTSTAFTEPSVVTYYRHPVNSFGFYCSGLLFDEAMCSGFADRLTSLPLEPLTFPDDGVWPYRANIGGYYAAPSQYFTYSDQSAWTEAKELLAEYVRNLDHNCGRLLEVTNWQDDNERSWEIRPNTEAESRASSFQRQALRQPRTPHRSLRPLPVSHQSRCRRQVAHLSRIRELHSRSILPWCRPSPWLRASRSALAFADVLRLRVGV